MAVQIPLSRDAYERIERITSTEQSEEFLQQHPLEADKIFRNAIIMSAGGGVLGAYIGNLCGRTIKSVVKRGAHRFACNVYPLVNYVDKVTTVFGFVFGAKKTGNLAHEYQIAKIPLSNNYIHWKNQAIRDQIYPMFNQFLREELDADLLCSIGHDLISYPVRCPRGHLYEKQTIEDWIDHRHAAGIYDEHTCPFRSGVLTKEMLRYDESYFREVTSALKQVLTKELREAIRAGLIAYRDAVSQNNVAAARELQTILNRELESNRITPAEWITAQNQIAEKL